MACIYFYIMLFLSCRFCMCSARFARTRQRAAFLESVEHPFRHGKSVIPLI